MEILKPYRARIDALDDQIVDLLAERIGIVDEVAGVKAAQDIPAVLPDRVAEVIDRTSARAAGKGLDAGMVRELYTRIVAYCCDRESEKIKSARRDLSRAG